MCLDCQRLHEELHKQSAIMYGLRKRISSLKGELRYERKTKALLIKEKKKKEPLRKGQKRGFYGRIG